MVENGLIISYGARDENKYCKHTGTQCQEPPGGCASCSPDDIAGAKPDPAPAIPDLVGPLEAAQIMEWNPKRIHTYIQRGRFPAPVARLACGQVWTRQQIEDFKAGLKMRPKPMKKVGDRP